MTIESISKEEFKILGMTRGRAASPEASAVLALKKGDAIKFQS